MTLKSFRSGKTPILVATDVVLRVGHPARHARHQLRPPLGHRRLRPPHRTHGARGEEGTRHRVLHREGRRAREVDEGAHRGGGPGGAPVPRRIRGPRRVRRRRAQEGRGRRVQVRRPRLSLRGRRRRRRRRGMGGGGGGCGGGGGGAAAAVTAAAAADTAAAAAVRVGLRCVGPGCVSEGSGDGWRTADAFEAVLPGARAPKARRRGSVQI